MPIEPPVLTPEKQQQAGHYEVRGETYAAFELFEHGWNPYSRFLDVDKVDFILRKLHEKKPVYREAQVKFGKLYAVSSKWEKTLFDVTTWRFFKVGEFDAYRNRKDFFLLYVMSAGTGDDREIFVFPIKVFCELIEKAIDRKSKKDGTKKVMYISRSIADKSRWCSTGDARKNAGHYQGKRLRGQHVSASLSPFGLAEMTLLTPLKEERAGVYA